MNQMNLVSPPIVAIAICLTSFCRGADPLDQWNWRNPLPQGNDLSDVCYGDGRFVAVGEGSILTSTDGTIWNLHTFGPSVRLHAVTYGNGLYVAVGDAGTIVTSTDGVTWSLSEWGTADLGAVTYGGGRFAAVSSSHAQGITVLISDDGSTWNQQSAPLPYGDSGWLSGVAYGGGRFVAVGTALVPQPPFPPTRPIAYASDDGVVWTNLAPSPGILNHITFALGQFAATAGPAGLITLTFTNDAATWRNVPVPVGSGEPVTGVASGNDRLLTIGGSGTFVTTTNGTDWIVTGHASQDPSSYFTGLADGPDGIVAVGLYGEISTSPEGVNWTERSTGTWGWFSSVAYGNDRFVAVNDSYSAGLMISSDGTNWDVHETGTNFRPGKVAFGKDQFVGVGGSGAIATSADGVTWNPHVSGTTKNLLGVEYWSGQYVAVGDQGTILTSVDGTNWNSRTTGTSNALVNVTGGNGAVVAVGFASTVVTSTNGIVWNVQKIGPSTSYILGIAYGHGQFVAAGGEYSGLVWTSEDGNNWTSQSHGTGAYVNAMRYGAGQFVAVGSLAAGGGAIVTSADGVSWTQPRLVTSHSLRGAVFGGDTFVVVGNDGAILQSGLFPRLGPLLMQSGGLEGNITASVGQSLQIQASTNLKDWVILTNVVSTNATVRFLDFAPTNFGRRFYRGLVPSQ